MSALDIVETHEAEIAAEAPVETEQQYRKRKLGFFFWASVVWLALLVFSAVFAKILPLKDPNETFRGVSRQGPSVAHWFGADNIGHDVFARTIYGARRSLFVATVATAMAMVCGGALGLISGFYRRGLDGAVSVLVTVLLSIPGLVLLLSLVAFIAPPGEASPSKQTFWVTIGLGIIFTPGITRVTRALTMVWSDRDFVMAARTLGARNKRIIVREILPNIVPTLISFAFVGIAVLILLEAALAFFGVGDVTGVSWGLMINNGRSQLERSPHMVLFPALFMFLTILALNFVGDEVRRYFDVREAGI
jgi:peptide/nickel transport system permease protein